MTDSPDYRKYLEEKFEGLHKLFNANFINIHDKLDSIETQVKKTNGTVTEHSKIITKNLPHTLLHCSQTKNIENQTKDIDEIKKALLKEDTIEKIEEKQKKESHDKFIKRLQLIGTLVAIGLLVLTVYNSFKNKEMNTKMDAKIDSTMVFRNVTRSVVITNKDSLLNELQEGLLKQIRRRNAENK